MHAKEKCKVSAVIYEDDTSAPEHRVRNEGCSARDEDSGLPEPTGRVV
jgi:hypothetical protein